MSTHIESLRPDSFNSFGGQDSLVSQLRIIIDGAKARDELCDHLLFSGPPGLGKTTLSHIVANELGCALIVTSGPALERAGDLASILSAMSGPTVVFIDEIHRLDITVEETLYPAMEDGTLDIVIGEGTKSRALRVPLEPFVLIGATTQSGMLSAPLRDRFGFVGRLRLYNEADLARIVARSAAVLGIDVTAEGAAAIARRSRGTPRIANSLVRRARDWANHSGADEVGVEEAEAAMEAFGVDPLGLDSVDLEILKSLCVNFAGTPVGLSTLASAVGEAPNTLEEVYEPFLMGQGLMVRTPRGRMATPAAFEHLGVAHRGPAGTLIQGAFDGFDPSSDES